MGKIEISKEEIKQIIKEEYSKKITEIKLKDKLRQIDEEIQKIVSEDMEEGLEEVKTGGQTTTVGPDGITKAKKWEPEFQKKGSHLVEDDATEIPSEDLPSDTPDDEPLPDENLSDNDEAKENLDIEEILAKLADAIEQKIDSTVEEKVGGEEGKEEIPVTDEIPTDENPDTEEGIDEKKETCKEGCAEEGVVKEQDGTSVAQEQKPKDAIPFDNGKAEIPKTGQLVSESTKKRMQILSGIKKNDFND